MTYPFLPGGPLKFPDFIMVDFEPMMIRKTSFKIMRQFKKMQFHK